MNAIKTQMTPEEQLEDLQRRFQLLEGERKATYETAQLNIRQNKEIIKQMKEESKWDLLAVTVLIKIVIYILQQATQGSYVCT